MATGIQLPVVGSVTLYAGFVPVVTGLQEPITGWLLCNGTHITTGTYPDLEAFLGGRWGFDGTGIFLPNFNTTFIRADHDSGAGTNGGESTHTLTSGELGAHTHSLQNLTPGFPNSTSTAGAHTHSGNFNAANSGTHQFYAGDVTQIREGGSGTTLAMQVDQNTDGFGGLTPDNTTVDSSGISHDHVHSLTIGTTAGGHNHTGSTDALGGGGAHNNLPPYLGLHFLIRY